MDGEEASQLVTTLFDRWYPVLVRYALRITANHELAEDLVQETFMQLYKSLRSGRTIDHPKAWTLCVLRRSMNRERQNLSRERALRIPLEEVEVVENADIEGLHKDDIRRLLSVLTPREEEVLLLRLESLRYRDIAEQLGIGMNTVNTLLARALRKLQQAVAQKSCERSVK